jgi:flagellar hook-associated protein 2
MATGSVDGLISGMDTATIISQLMQLERQPQTRLKTQRDTANQALSVYQTLNTKFSALSSAALAASRASDWTAMKATSSNGAAVTASATSTAQTGTLSFSVQQLSRAGSVASSATVASTTAVVATGPFLVSKGADLLGFARLGSGAALTVGAHTVEVTTATAAAVKSGTGALAASTTIDATNQTIDVTVDGQARTWTIAGGAYATRESLAAAVQAAANAAGAGEVSVTVGSGNELRIATTREGSAASLQITGGTARAALNLTTDGSAITGQAGQVKVDGTTIPVNSVKAGETAALTGANGAVNVVFAGGLRKGTVTATNVDTGNGSLASLVDAVNRAGVGVSAAAVKVGTDSYRLQLTSTTTGAGTNVTVGTDNLIGLGSFSTTLSGRDALIRVGEGAGAYDVTSSTNSMTDVLPGVTLQLRTADPSTTVTVTVDRDADALAGKVAALVEAANGALSYIKAQASYDPTTKKAGVLLSDGMARSLQSQVFRAVSDAVAASSLGSAGAAGLAMARDGTVTFDKAKFLDAYAKNPEAVSALFRQGGTATDSRVSFLSASAKTQAGTYAVAITAPATQAAATGAVLGGGLTAGETIDVRVGGEGGVTASYTAAAGATLTQVADGLNAALAQKSLAVSAQVVGGALVLRSVNYGTAAKFEVRSSAAGAGQTGIVAAPATWEPHTGTDVAGPINGLTATGSGQTLTAPATDATLAGLALTVTATSAGALGTFSYTPGVAQRLSSVASAAVEFGTGAINTAINGRQSLIRSLDGRIADWDVRLADKEKNLRRQFANLETALGKLRDKSNWLAGQLAGLGGGQSR